MVEDRPPADAEPPEPALSPSSPQSPPESIDKLWNALLQRHAKDIAEWLLGEPVRSVDALETTHPMVQVRRSDKLLRVTKERGAGIALHLEVQLRGEKSMPFRMAEYFGAQLRVFLECIEAGYTPAAVVLYLDRELYVEDPGEFHVAGEMGYSFHVQYKVVKLWEIPAEPVLAMEKPGLLPFVPLMAGNPVELVVRSVEKIRKAPSLQQSPDDQQFLLETLATFAGRVLRDMNITEMIASDPELLESHLFYRAGKLKGRGEGRDIAVHRDLVAVLEARFGELPADLRARLDALHDPERLDALVVQAARAADLDAFRASLDATA